ncbi:MAG: hypothetical protein QXX30_00860 [Candidatus Aenigmatarchaeota archaeon]
MERAIIFKKGVPFLYEDDLIYLYDLLPNPDTITYKRNQINLSKDIISLSNIRIVPVVTKLRIRGKESFFDFIKINIPLGLPIQEIYKKTLIPIGIGVEKEIKGSKATVYVKNYMDSDLESVIQAIGNVLGIETISETKIELIISDIKTNKYGIPQNMLDNLNNIDDLKNILINFPYLNQIFKISNPQNIQVVSTKFIEEQLLKSEKIPLNFAIIGQNNNDIFIYFVERIQLYYGTELGKTLKSKEYQGLRKVYTYFCRNRIKDKEDMQNFISALTQIRTILTEYYKDIRSNMIKIGDMFIKTKPINAGITDEFCIDIKKAQEINIVKVPMLPDNEKRIEFKYVPITKDNKQPYLYLIKYYYFFDKIKKLLDKGHKGLAVQHTTQWLEYLKGKRVSGLKEMVLEFKNALKSENKEEYKETPLYKQLKDYDFSITKKLDIYENNSNSNSNKKVDDWYNHMLIPILPAKNLVEHINNKIYKHKGVEKWKKQKIS